MIKTFLIILLVTSIIAAIAYYFKLNKINKNKSRVHKKMQERKEMTMERILKLFENKERITNQEVQSILLIEELETNEYLIRLENDGKIKKMGENNNIYYIRVEEEKKK